MLPSAPGRARAQAGVSRPPAGPWRRPGAVPHGPLSARNGPGRAGDHGGIGASIEVEGPQTGAISDDEIVAGVVDDEGVPGGHRLGELDLMGAPGHPDEEYAGRLVHHDFVLLGPDAHPVALHAIPSRRPAWIHPVGS